MSCIRSASYSILINGTPWGYIKPTRGIRQGDPLSPYIYLLCTEGLSSLLHNMKKGGKIHGFRPSQTGPSITHMLFADDSLLYCRAEENECSRLMEALHIYGTLSERKRNSSFAWKGLCGVKDMVERGIKWIVGDGQKIRIWKDRWLPTDPPRPPKPKLAGVSQGMKVSDIFNSNAKQWIEDKLMQLVDPQDVQYIRRIRPGLTMNSDNLEWIYDKSGAYSVKSAYYLSHTISQSQSMQENHHKFPFTRLWKMKTLPKVKQFWWRVLNAGIPVGEQLRQRGLNLDTNCQLCGEEEETVQHLLFHCRVAKEIWSLAPLDTPSAEQIMQNSLKDNVEWVIKCTMQVNGAEANLAAFLGWRIWKARNNLIFANSRPCIPELIRKAIFDMEEWLLANNKQEEQTKGDKKRDNQTSHYTNVISGQSGISNDNSHLCNVDASWVSENEVAGIGWLLRSPDGKPLIQGSMSIQPISNVLEAEAFALREAIMQMRRLGYFNVIFRGDNSELYAHLESWNSQKRNLEINHRGITPYLVDIDSFSTSPFCFRFQIIKRESNVEADRLAKKARMEGTECRIRWL